MTYLDLLITSSYTFATKCEYKRILLHIVPQAKITVYIKVLNNAYFGTSSKSRYLSRYAMEHQYQTKYWQTSKTWTVNFIRNKIKVLMWSPLWHCILITSYEIKNLNNSREKKIVLARSRQRLNYECWSRLLNVLFLYIFRLRELLINIYFLF